MDINSKMNELLNMVEGPKVIVKIDKFDPEKVDAYDFIQQLDYFCVFNNI